MAFLRTAQLLAGTRGLGSMVWWLPTTFTILPALREPECSVSVSTACALPASRSAGISAYRNSSVSRGILATSADQIFNRIQGQPDSMGGCILGERQHPVLRDAGPSAENGSPGSR